MARHILTTAAAVLVLAALAGCGSDTGSSGASGSSDASSPTAFDVDTATLTDQPFCDELDASRVGTVLGMAPDKVRVTVDRTVGDKYEGTVEEEGLKVSDVNMCILGSATKQFIVTVQPVSSAGRVQKTIDDLAGQKEGYGQVCWVEDDAGFGTPGAVAECHGTAGSTRKVAVTTGLVGDGKFYCGAIVNTTSKGTDLTAPVVETCRGILEELATA